MYQEEMCQDGQSNIKQQQQNGEKGLDSLINIS